MTRWLIILLGVVVLGAVVASFAIGPKGIPVDAAPVRRSSIREYIEEQAKTRLPDVYQITMPLQGRILPISLDEGDPVQQGQLVAQMDAEELDTDLIERSNTVESYSKNLEQMQLAIEQSEQTVQASQATYDFAERVFSRTKTLIDARSASRDQLERDELEMTRASLDLQKEKLNKNIYVIMKGIVELFQETEIAKKAKTVSDRQRAMITSPVSGIVLSKAVSNEKVLAAGEVLLEIGEPDKLQIEADVLTQDVVKAQVGDIVDIKGPAIGPQPVQGKVARIFPQGFTKVSSLGVEQQRVKVVIDFDSDALAGLKEQGRSLGVDYRVMVKIYTDEKSDTLTIPRSALYRNAAGQWEVFVVRSRIARRVVVTVGLKNDFEVEVLDGVNDDDLVIVAPDSALDEGTRVEPILATDL